MMRWRFFLRLVRRSLADRLGQSAVSIGAVAMGAALVCASLSLAVGTAAKVSGALRAYGANIVLVSAPAAGGEGATEHTSAPLSEDVLAVLSDLTGRLPVLGYAPLLYAVGTVGSHRVAVLGTASDSVRRINPSWRADGRWFDDRTGDEAVVGAALARKLELAIGGSLTLTMTAHTRTFRVVGLLGTGGSEDEQVLVPLAAAQELAGRAGQVSLVQVSASATGDGLERVARALEAGLPGVSARMQLRVIAAEARLLARVALLLGLIAGFVLMASASSVTAVITTSVIQRTPEIGLMKALGASRWRVGGLFFTEAGAIGLAGGALGAAVGVAVANAVVRSAFGGTLPFAMTPVVTSVAVALVAASLAGVMPAVRAASVEPAIVLRGD